MANCAIQTLRADFTPLHFRGTGLCQNLGLTLVYKITNKKEEKSRQTHTRGAFRTCMFLVCFKKKTMLFAWDISSLGKGLKQGRNALNTFYLRLYGVRHMVKDHSDSEKGNPLPPHRLLFPINSKGSFICIIPQTG